MATTAAQASLRPTAAVAGMTIPAVERRSPASPSPDTSTRSWSIRMGNRSADGAAGTVGAPLEVWVTAAG